MSDAQNQFKILSDNRKARYNYFLFDKYECGLVLTGTEVKSARTGRIQLQDSFAEVTGNEVWLCNAHFSPYSHGNRANHDAVRRRKLLMHRAEINKLVNKSRDRGFTLVPTKIYLKDGLVKCEIAVAKGKKQHDKRDSERKRDADNEIRAEVGRRKAMLRD